MAARRKTARRRPTKHAPPTRNAHAFWEGSISFGLVNVPVQLFPATRNADVRFRLVSPEGVPLQRRYFCPSQDKDVSRDEIVRGYEFEKGSYVTVEDKELIALEPRKSREIDLREFVDLDEIPIAYFERGYYLVPSSESTKAYRLLAHAMEESGKAGISTFVMRDREYLLAIFARRGILCGETLRFHDEIRDPEKIGLPEPQKPGRAGITKFLHAIDALASKDLREEDLSNEDAERLRMLIEQKQKADEDVFWIEERDDHRDSDEFEQSDAEVDLLETIRKSLQQYTRRTSSSSSRTRSKSSHPRADSKKPAAKPKNSKKRTDSRTARPGKGTRKKART